MAGKLNVAGSAVALDALSGRVTQTSGTRYLGITTVIPGVTSTLASVTEYARTGYSRQVITPSAPTGTGPKVQTHSNAINFGALSGANGTDVVNGWFITDAASGTSGTIYAQGDWTATRTPAAGDTLNVAAGAVTWQID